MVLKREIGKFYVEISINDYDYIVYATDTDFDYYTRASPSNNGEVRFARLSADRVIKSRRLANDKEIVYLKKLIKKQYPAYFNLKFKSNHNLSKIWF